MKYKSVLVFGIIIFAYLYSNRPSAKVNAPEVVIADSFQDSNSVARQPIIQR